MNFHPRQPASGLLGWLPLTLRGHRCLLALLLQSLRTRGIRRQGLEFLGEKAQVPCPTSAPTPIIALVLPNPPFLYPEAPGWAYIQMTTWSTAPPTTWDVGLRQQTGIRPRELQRSLRQPWV